MGMRKVRITFRLSGGALGISSGQPSASVGCYTPIHLAGSLGICAACHTATIKTVSPQYDRKTYTVIPVFHGRVVAEILESFFQKMDTFRADEGFSRLAHKTWKLLWDCLGE